METLKHPCNCKFDSVPLTLFTSSLYLAALASSIVAGTVTRKLSQCCSVASYSAPVLSLTPSLTLFGCSFSAVFFSELESASPIRYQPFSHSTCCYIKKKCHFISFKIHVLCSLPVGDHYDIFNLFSQFSITICIIHQTRNLNQSPPYNCKIVKK